MKEPSLVNVGGSLLALGGTNGTAITNAVSRYISNVSPETDKMPNTHLTHKKGVLFPVSEKIEDKKGLIFFWLLKYVLRIEDKTHF